MDASHLKGEVSGRAWEGVDPPSRRHQSAQGGRCSVFTGNRRVRMNRIVVGVDITKRVFQLHWVEPETGEIVALQLKRERF